MVNIETRLMPGQWMRPIDRRAMYHYSRLQKGLGIIPEFQLMLEKDQELPWNKAEQFIKGALTIHEIYSHQLKMGHPIRYIMPNEHRHSLHWTDGSEMDFSTREGYAASPFQAFVMSYMQYMGAKQWALELYMETKSTTDPMRLHEIMLRHTKYGQPFRLRIRAYLESGKALVVVQKAIIAWIKSSPKLREALLQTGEDYLLMMGPDTFWEAELRRVPDRYETSVEFAGYNWVGIILMTLRARLRSEEAKRTQKLDAKGLNPTLPPPPGVEENQTHASGSSNLLFDHIAAAKDRANRPASSQASGDSEPKRRKKKKNLVENATDPPTASPDAEDSAAAVANRLQHLTTTEN